MPRKEAIFILIVSVFIIFYGVIVHNRNKDWRTAIGFYEKTAKHANSYRVFNNLGVSYAKKGLLIKAAESYRKALLLDPKNPVAYHNIANGFLYLGEKDAAKAFYYKALECDKNFIFSRNMLSLIN